MPLPMTGCRRQTFALLDQRERSHLHLTTASLLADAARQAAGNELLFRAVHHVTAALDSIQPAPQRQMFRELSLLAARRAKRTGDYHSALSYIQNRQKRWAMPGRCLTLCSTSKRRAVNLRSATWSEPASCVTRSSAAPAG